MKKIILMCLLVLFGCDEEVVSAAEPELSGVCVNYYVQYYSGDGYWHSLECSNLSLEDNLDGQCEDSIYGFSEDSIQTCYQFCVENFGPSDPNTNVWKMNLEDSYLCGYNSDAGDCTYDFLDNIDYEFICSEAYNE